MKCRSIYRKLSISHKLVKWKSYSICQFVAVIKLMQAWIETFNSYWGENIHTAFSMWHWTTLMTTSIFNNVIFRFVFMSIVCLKYRKLYYVHFCPILYTNIHRHMDELYLFIILGWRHCRYRCCGHRWIFGQVLYITSFWYRTCMFWMF